MTSLNYLEHLEHLVQPLASSQATCVSMDTDS